MKNTDDVLAPAVKPFKLRQLYPARPKPPPEHEIRRPTRHSDSQAGAKLRRIIQQQKADLERAERNLQGQSDRRERHAEAEQPA